MTTSPPAVSACGALTASDDQLERDDPEAASVHTALMARQRWCGREPRPPEAALRWLHRAERL